MQNNSLKDVLKFKVLPKKTYLRYSARNKYRRADRGEPELRLLPFLVDKNKAAIDVGANTGLYTYFLSQLAKNVYSFEPHKKLADFLVKATDKNVTVFNKAVSNDNSEHVFYTPVINGKKSLNIASFDRESIKQYECEEEIIKSVQLDELDLEDIGFIKIDVEGHELSVLKGAVKTINKFRPVMLIEILPDGKKLTDDKTVAFMREQKYEMFNLHDNILKIITGDNSDNRCRNIIFLPAEHRLS